MKSYVSLEQKICMITGKVYPTNDILLDKRLKKSLENHTTTGYGICPEAQEKLDSGFIALIGVDEEKSTIIDGKITSENAYRTGDLAYLKAEVAIRLLDVPIGNHKWIFVDPKVIKHLEERIEK